jgi:hypothetical protein
MNITESLSDLINKYKKPKDGGYLDKPIPLDPGLLTQLEQDSYIISTLGNNTSGTFTINASNSGSVTIADPAAYKWGSSGTTTSTHMWSTDTPVYDLTDPIGKPVFPFSDDTVFRDTKYPKNYILKYVKSYSKDNSELDYTPMTTHTNISMIASVGDDLYGTTPEQLLTVVSHFIKSLEPSEELTAAAKHVQYALGFLQKDSINKSKL